MKKILIKAISVVFAVVSLCVVLAMTSSAADGWTYADKLPSGITADKYYIEYRNTYKTVAKASPGAGWVNKGFSKTVYENVGESYESAIELETSETRQLVSYYYYHWCSSSMGTRVNFSQLGAYNHFDSIAPNPSSFYEAGQYTDDDDARYKSYALKYHNGTNVYCSSGFSCDGQFGSHGPRSYIWYKMCRYQDKVKADYYNYEKQGDWTDKVDSSAASYTVRYKIKHTHSYTDYTISAKASFTKDGSKYRKCKTCGYKQTVTISKVSGVTLSATSYVYDGKNKTPSVTAKNSKGTKLSKSYYSVTLPDSRKNVGTHKVTVKLKGKYYSGTKTLTFNILPGRVTGVKASPKKSAITLSWNKLPGNVQYRIYSYNKSTKKLTYLATTSSTAYTQQSLKSKNSYSYVVRGYKQISGKNYYGSKSSVVTAQPYGVPTKVTGLTSSARNSSTINLKWNKAYGNRVRYYVYSYNSSTGKYTSLGKTTATSFKVTNLKADTYYKFSVRAYSPAGNTGYFGSRSDIYTVKTNKKIIAPDVSSFNVSTEKKLNNMLISWNVNSSATGYQIYKSTSTKSSSFQRLATVNAASASSYRDTNIVPGKTYYYKIRSYKKSNGELAYGKFSYIMRAVSYSAWRENLTISDYTYNFSNSFRGFGYPEGYVIPLSSYQIIFGKNELAYQMYEKYGKWGGSCHGMSASSALMNVRTSGVTLSMFNPSATRVSHLGVNDVGSLGISVRQFIEAMQLSQMSSQIYSNRVWDEPDKLLKEVCWVPYTGKPVIIGIRNELKGVSHALLALRAVKISDSQVNIELYDSNFPNQLRNLIIYTNSAGKATGWYYCNNDIHDVGSAYPTSRIEYLTYDVYSAMWTKRGSFTSGLAESNALMVNTESFIIYDEEGNKVAGMKNGEFSSVSDDIYAVDTEYVFGTDESAPELIYLPTDETYTVVNTDDSVELFEATMVNVDRSAEVSTQADTVSFTVSDETQTNEVCIEAEKDEQYSVVLDSSEKDEERIEIFGSAEGETVSVSQ